MYKCDDCNAVFESPYCGKEYSEHFGSPGYAGYTGCPYCGGDYSAAYECAGCGEDFPAHELYNGYCKACAKIVEQQAMERIGAAFVGMDAAAKRYIKREMEANSDSDLLFLIREAI